MQFQVIDGEKGPQAAHVTGVCGGSLLCEHAHTQAQTGDDNTQVEGATVTAVATGRTPATFSKPAPPPPIQSKNIKRVPYKSTKSM